MTNKRIPYSELQPKPRALLDVDRRAERFERARLELCDAIVTAHLRDGYSLRSISEASRIYSHEQVRRIVNEAKRPARKGAHRAG
jgi:hypothetical protein